MGSWWGVREHRGNQSPRHLSRPLTPATLPILLDSIPLLCIMSAVNSPALKPSITLWLLCSVILWIPSTAQAAGSYYEDAVKEWAETVVVEVVKTKRHTLGVLNFTDIDGNVTPAGRFLAEELSATLMLSGDVQVLDRQHMAKTVPESALYKLSVADPAATKKFGLLAGVDCLVIGTIADTPEGLRVTAKVLATDTGLVIGGSRSIVAKAGPLVDLLKPPKPEEPPKAVRPAAPPGTPTYENEWYRMLVGSAKRSKNKVSLTLFIENLAGRDFRLLCRLQGTYLEDDQGGEWHLDIAKSREGLCIKGMSLQPGNKRRAMMEFVNEHPTSDGAFTLRFHENGPRRDVVFTIPDIKPEAPGGK